MNKILVLIFLVAISLSVTACEDGDTGPMGITGPSGMDGIKGDRGGQGNQGAPGPGHAHLVSGQQLVCKLARNHADELIYQSEELPFFDCSPMVHGLVNQDLVRCSFRSGELVDCTVD